jgi:hypothetical protein
MYQKVVRRRILRSAVVVLIAVLSGVVLAGVPAAASTGQNIVTAATGQLGGTGCNPGYFNSCGINWCAEFARWAWSHGGVSDLAGLDSWAQSFKTYGSDRGTYHSRSSGYTPRPGDAVVFDWDHVMTDEHPIDHVAIVTSVSGGTLNTIGGNQGGTTVYDSTVSRASYSLSNGDIDGYVEPAGVSGAASVYGVLSDGRLTFTNIDGATGVRTHGAVTSSATLGFTPKALATLNFNTLLVTSTGGSLYRVDILTNNTSLTFNVPVYLGGGWTHDLLAYDGSGHLFGIAAGTLRRYNIGVAKPTSADITGNTVIGTGFTLKTLTTTGPDWILGTTSSGQLISYKINGAGNWNRYELRSSTWQVFDSLLSPGGGVYYGHRTDGSLNWYIDSNPFDGNGADLSGQGAVDTGGWTQVLLSAQPGTVG